MLHLATIAVPPPRYSRATAALPAECCTAHRVIKKITENPSQKYSSGLLTMFSSSAAEPSTATCHDNNTEWEVQDILAARTSVTGDDEVLVVWKPSWTPISNVKDGPGIRRYQTATKWKFTSAISGMRIILPVEPGTLLADDHAVMQQMAKAAKCKYRKDGSQVHAQDLRPSGPRKSLGAVAKRKLQSSSQQSEQSQDSSASI